MNIYVIWTRSGTRYFVRGSFAFWAIYKIETIYHETVSSWDIATSLPENATIL